MPLTGFKVAPASLLPDGVRVTARDENKKPPLVMEITVDDLWITERFKPTIQSRETRHQLVVDNLNTISDEANSRYLRGPIRPSEKQNGVEQFGAMLIDLPD